MAAWLDRRRLALALSLAGLALVALAGCQGLVEDIGNGGGRAPADLATSQAERAGWPGAPKDRGGGEGGGGGGGGGVGRGRGHLHREGEGTAGTDPGDRRRHPGVGGAQPAGRALRRGGVGLRQALPRRRDGAARQGRRAAGPLRGGARPPVGGGRGVLE